jgi:hypothetical protein
MILELSSCLLITQNKAFGENMPISELENYLINKNNKQFSNQTFEDFRTELLQYANSFYKDQILDFSEVSLGGMLLDFAAIVGDSLVYYAEQQFNELDYETATDPDNIQKHLRRANIKNPNASPSSVMCTLSIEVERDSTTPDYKPEPIKSLLPVIKKGTTVSADNGITFILQEDIDFTTNYEQEIGEENEDGTAFSLFLSKEGLFISGTITEETFKFPKSEKGYFLSRELENEGVTSIISVVDEDNNEYYEVDFLTQTTIFKKTVNSNDNYITIVPAPRRFIVENEFLFGKTLLRFGNGEGKDIKGNIFSNPEDLLIPLKNKDTISRVDLDPSMLLENSNFGISPRGKEITVKYKHGGGPSHNLPAGTINVVAGDPIITFPNSEGILTNDVTSQIINSLSIENKTRSIGGESPLSLDELKQQIPNAIRSQSRIITYEDLISRILTMPSDFGKINKAIALDNLYSSSTKDLFIVCKSNEGFHTEANDAIKTNLSNYLNDFRIIGDNFNILDVPVFNFGISLKIKVKSGFDLFNVILEANTRIIEILRFDLFQIGSPIDLNLIAKVVESTDGVESILTPKNSIVVSKNSEDAFFDSDALTTRSYNDNVFNPQILYKDGFIYPPRGGLFEMRYTLRDIVIAAN